MINLNYLKLTRQAGVISLVLFLAACGGTDGSDTTTTNISQGTGKMTLGITDAPVDGADAVIVQFTGIEFIPAEGNNVASTVITFDVPKTIDLLALQGDVRELLLANEELPAGQYGQIRLIVKAEYDNVMDSYIVVNGAQHELRIPSGNQTGLKLVHAFNVESASDTDFTIDFDLRKSVVFAPGQGYMLKPVLRLVETVRAATISGLVDPSVFAGLTCNNDPLVGYGIYLYEGSGVTPDDLGSAGQPLITTGVVLNENSNYAYTIGFVEPGNYTISATCQADSDAPETDDTIEFVTGADITVTAGATTTHNFQ